MHIQHSDSPLETRTSHVASFVRWIKQNSPICYPSLLVDTQAGVDFVQNLSAFVNKDRDVPVLLLGFLKTGPSDLFFSLPPEIPLVTSAREYAAVPKDWKKILYLGKENLVDKQYDFLQALSVFEVHDLIAHHGIPQQFLLDGHYRESPHSDIIVPAETDHYLAGFLEYLIAINQLIATPVTNVIRVKHIPTKFDYRHGHSSGLTVGQIKLLRSKYRSLRFGASLYLGNPLRESDLDSIHSYLKELRDSVEVVGIGGFGGFGDNLPLLKLKEVVREFSPLQIYLELGTVLVERSCALAFPASWSDEQIIEFIPDAEKEGKQRIPIIMTFPNGKLVFRPISYVTTQKSKVGEDLPVRYV